jgi:hypothetical protein
MPAKGFCMPPPSEWLSKRKAEIHKASGMIPDDGVLLHEWRNMTSSKRAGQVKAIRQKQRRLERAKAQVDAGTSSVRTQNIVKNSGYRRYDTPEDAAAGYKVSTIEKHVRRSEWWLNYTDSRAPGCSVPGCVLATCNLQSLLQDDHLDETLKVGCTWKLYGAQFEAEILKTVRVCAWHHFLHTRVQLGYHPVDDEVKGSTKRIIRQMKQEAECQCAGHQLFSFAELIPDAPQDSLRYGFFQVSHIERTSKVGTGISANDKLQQHLEDLESRPPRALLFCTFCHLLWTLCERNTIQLTQGWHLPYTSVQYARLQKTPGGTELIQQFSKLTANTDWKKIVSEQVRGPALNSNGKRSRTAKAPTLVGNKRAKRTVAGEPETRNESQACNAL